MQTLLVTWPNVLGSSERWLCFPDKTFPPPPLRLRKGCKRGGRKNSKSWDIKLNVTLCIWHSYWYHNLPAAALCLHSDGWSIVKSGWGLDQGVISITAELFAKTDLCVLLCTHSWPHQAPMDSSNPMIIHTDALVKLNDSENKPKLHKS